ncbi:MAG: sugar transferase [Planctomycetota bacterium]
MICSNVNDFSTQRRAPATRLPGVGSCETFRAEFARQQAMVRYHRYNFSLLIFDVQASMAGQTRKFSRTLANGVRSTDEVGWVGDDQLGAILPHTSVLGAAHLAGKIRDLARKDLATVNYTVYTFGPNAPADSGKHITRLEALSSNTLRSAAWHADSRESGCPRQAPAPRGAAHNQASILRQRPMPIWKRGMDILGSLLGLLVLSPLFFFVALFIKTVSKGPIFFRQERVGYCDRIFRMWKFRTYEVDYDTDQHRHYMSGLIDAAQRGNDTSQSPMAKLDNAAGIIPFGNLLRKTCIDELPQLINVLLGEMSLVGPRPPITYEAEKYTDWHRQRLDAVPGMTGLWQVSGKNRLSFNEMVRLDIRYSRMKSFWLDTMVLLKTPLAICSQIVDSLLSDKLEVVVEH